MRLPDWWRSMRRRPKDIKVKDFVTDENTRKELAKIAAPERKHTHTTGDEMLNYLAESRTIQEVMTRFGYSSLASTYQMLKRLERRGLVTLLGHGLYMRSASAMKTFNVAELDDKELSERGYEALQRTLAEQKANPPVAVDHPKRGPRSASILTIRNKKARKNAMVKYLQDPHTAREVMNEFGYQALNGSMYAIVELVKAGRVVKLPGRNLDSSFTFIAKNAASRPMPTPEALLEGLNRPQPSQVVERPEHILHPQHMSVENLAKDWIWSLKPGSANEDWARSPLGVMQQFITWVKTSRKQEDK